MAVLITPPKIQFLDNDGNPLSGGKVQTYTAGTTSPKATYTDQAATIPNSNPVILDAAGRADIWIDGSYRFDVFDSADVLISSTDDITSFSTLAEAVSPYFESFSGDGSTTSFVLSQDVGTDSENVMIFADSGLQEHVTNGQFDTDSDWTKGAGWTISGGQAVATGGISTSIEQVSSVTLVEGQAYSVTYTMTRTAGSLVADIGGNTGTARSTSGTYEEVIIAGSGQDLKFTGSGFTGTLDIVKVTVACSAGNTIKNPNEYTVNGTSLVFSTAPATGTNNIFVFAPSLLLGAASSAAAQASASASAAAASAASIAIATGTSTTSLAIGTGSKVFTTQADLPFNAGKWLLVTSDADPTNYMHGQVTSYSGTTLTLNVTNIGGSGTLADWTITISGTQGSKGDKGDAIDGLLTTKGDIASHNGTNAARLAVGTDGQALVADSGETLGVKWGDVSGGLVLLATASASASASVDFNSAFDSTYDEYILYFSGVIPVTDGAAFRARIKVGGVVQSGASDYEFISLSNRTGSTAAIGAGGTESFFNIGTGWNWDNASGSSVSGFVRFSDPASTSNYCLMESYAAGVRNTSNDLAHGFQTAIFKGSASAVDGFQFFFGTGNIDEGEFQLYGVKKS